MKGEVANEYGTLIKQIWPDPGTANTKNYVH